MQHYPSILNISIFLRMSYFLFYLTVSATPTIRNFSFMMLVITCTSGAKIMYRKQSHNILLHFCQIFSNCWRHKQTCSI